MPTDTNPSEKPRAHLIPIFILLGSLFLISSFLLFWNLSRFPFTDYDEAIYGQVFESTIENHSFFVLYDHGQPWFHKPPLYFWLAMGTDDVLHHPELSYRLPAAIAGLLGIVLIVLIAYEVSSNIYVATVAGFILAGMGDYIESARQLRLETAVISMVLLSFYSYVRARKDKRWLAGIFISVAIGILFKSVIGLFGLPIIAIFSLVEQDFSWLKSKYLWIGAGIGFLILLPWHAYESYKFGFAFWHDYLVRQVFKRFVSNVNGVQVSNWGYIRDTFLYTIPWGILFFGSAVSLFSKKFLGERYKTMIALVASTCFIFIFFAIAKTKIPYYVLPGVVLFPLVSALLFERAYLVCKTSFQRISFWITLTIFVLLGLGNAVYIGFHYQADFSGTQALVIEEQAVGLKLASEPVLTVGAFTYPYWDTIKYYSANKDPIVLLNNGSSTTTPIYMVMTTKLYGDQPFSPQVMAELQPLYQGKLVTLLRFTPQK